MLLRETLARLAGAAPAATGLPWTWCSSKNVGDLVCPAGFGVGEDARAVVYAVTEGEEEPLKYPVMFRSCGLPSRGSGPG